MDTIKAINMNIEEQFRVILKAARIRAAIDKVQQEKNSVVKNQRFEDACKLRDKEKLLYQKLDEVGVTIAEMYKQHFPEEDEIDQILL